MVLALKALKGKQQKRFFFRDIFGNTRNNELQLREDYNFAFILGYIAYQIPKNIKSRVKLSDIFNQCCLILK